VTATTQALHYLEIAELSALIEAREISPLEATRAQLDRITALG
jgi:amidase